MGRLTLLAAVLLGSLTLAGCLASTPATEAGPASQIEGDASDPLVRVDGNRSAVEPGQAASFRVLVENEGDAPVTYRAGCLSAWSFVVHDPSGKPVQAHRPRASCDGFTPSTLEPGERVSYPAMSGGTGYVWNGTVWNGSKWFDAEPGTYVLHARFEYTPEDGATSTVTGSGKIYVRRADGKPPSYDGLEVAARADREAIAPGEPVHVNYTVRNAGNRTVWYNDVCGSDWTVDVLEADGDRVRYTPHRMRCLALAWTRLEPGETHSYSYRQQDVFAWNGTVWNDSASDGHEYRNGTYEDAAAGTYTLRGTFRYALEKNGEVGRVSEAETVRVRDDEGGSEASVDADASASRDEIAPGETVHVNATATNEGDQAVTYRAGCGHAWDIAVVGPGGEDVQTRPPRAHCLGFSEEELAPGESVPYPGPDGRQPWAWNGTVWNGSAYGEAGPGNYTVRFSFPHEPGDGGGARTADASVTVRVGGD